MAPYKLNLPYRKAFYLLCEFWQCHILIHAPRADHLPSLPIILSSRRPLLNFCFPFFLKFDGNMPVMSVPCVHE